MAWTSSFDSAVQVLKEVWDGVHNGVTNMARDGDLLVRAGGGTCGVRVYRWTEPTVSLGMFQRADRDLLHPERMPWVMRPTGGKAVLHGHDETIGLAVPLSSLGLNTRSVREIYRAVIAPLLDALHQCGLNAELGERTKYSRLNSQARTADCFAHVSDNDIVNPSTGLKVCGCALRLTDRAVLIQASIPNGPPLVDPQSVFAQPAGAVSPTWDARDLPRHLQEALSATSWYG